jgi:hypothetical protein
MSAPRVARDWRGLVTSPRLLLTAVLLVSAALFCWSVWRHVTEILARTTGLDFHNYYFIAKGVIAKGASIYDHRTMEALSRAELKTRGLPVFVYPPLLIVIFLPLAKLPYSAARIVWLGFNEIFLFASAFGLARIYAARTGARVALPFTVAFALLAAAAFAPSIDHNWQGQSNFFVLMLTTWALYFHLKPKPSDVLTGALLAPAILLKVFPGIFVVYLVLRLRFRAVLWTGVFALAITALTLLVVPLSDYLAFPRVLFGSMYVRESASFEGNYSMAATAQSLTALVGAGGGATRVLAVVLRFLPCAALLGLAALERRAEPTLRGAAGLVPALRLSQGFLLMGLIMTKWWEHHLTLFLFPYFLGLYFVLKAPGRWRAPAAMLVVSAVLLAVGRHPLLWDHIYGGSWGSVRFALIEGKRLGIILLGAALEVMIWRLKRAPAESPLRDDGHAGDDEKHAGDHARGERVVEDDLGRDRQP